jgi:hypothetical protein
MAAAASAPNEPMRDRETEAVHADTHTHTHTRLLPLLLKPRIDGGAEPAFVCERVCTSPRLLRRMGGLSKVGFVCFALLFGGLAARFRCADGLATAVRPGWWRVKRGSGDRSGWRRNREESGRALLAAGARTDRPTTSTSCPLTLSHTHNPHTHSQQTNRTPPPTRASPCAAPRPKTRAPKPAPAPCAATRTRCRPGTTRARGAARPSARAGGRGEKSVWVGGFCVLAWVCVCLEEGGRACGGGRGWDGGVFCVKKTRGGGCVSIFLPLPKHTQQKKEKKKKEGGGAWSGRSLCSHTHAHTRHGPARPPHDHPPPAARVRCRRPQGGGGRGGARRAQWAAHAR